MINMKIVDEFIGKLKSNLVMLFLQSQNIHYNVERRGEDVVLDFDIPGHHIHLEGKILPRE